MNSHTCAICGATLQTSGDVCAEAAAKGWEVMDGGARCKKCRMAGNSGKFPEILGNSRLSDAEIDELERLAGEATPGKWSVYGDGDDLFFGICSTDKTICPTVPAYITCADGVIDYAGTENGLKNADAKYIVAANPAAVLSLIAEVRAARAAGKD